LISFRKIWTYRSTPEIPAGSVVGRTDMLYMAAFRHKIMPIIYTIGSAVLGLVPFILINKDQDFWYSFAIGTIAGLLFSLIGVFVYLPVFMKLDLQK